MTKFNFKAVLPYLAAVVAFLLITIVYFNPLLNGKVIKQHDIEQFKGMSKEIVNHRENLNEEAEWTNNMFAGMPATMISLKHDANLLSHIDHLLKAGLPHPSQFIFLLLLGFFLLLISLKADPWLAILGAILFAFSSYYIIVIQAGHNSKIHAIAYLPYLLSGIIVAYRKNLLIGSILTALFLGLEIRAGHIQITYYFLFFLLAFGITELLNFQKRGELINFFKRSAVLIGALIIGALSNSSNLLTALEYTPDSTRGKSDLTISTTDESIASNKTSGLNRDYITQWSYGKEETFTFLIPNAKGGGSGSILNDKELSKNPKVYNQIVDAYQKYRFRSNTYWGNQPITSGPVYLGALALLLFFLGAYYVKDRLKWAIIATVVLTILLGWGKNFMGLTDLFIDYVPLYSKFRAVTIILSITSFCIPILSILGLQYILKNKDEIAADLKPFFIICGSLIGLLFILYLIPGSILTFITDQELEMLNQIVSRDPQKQIIEPFLIDYRIFVFRSDVLRSLFFILIGSGLILGYLKGILKKATPLVAILSVIALIDMAGVSSRYLGPKGDKEKWTNAKSYAVPHHATAADLKILESEKIQNPELASDIESYFIKKRKELGKEFKSNKATGIYFDRLNQLTNYSVLDISSGDPYQNARASYYHRSLGGYHGAKMQRYKELIDFYLGPLNRGIGSNKSPQDFQNYFRNAGVWNMLNLKYIITNPKGTGEYFDLGPRSPFNQDTPGFINPFRLGNAWFVNEVKQVENADEEIKALGKGFDPSLVAIVDKRYQAQLKAFDAPINTDHIELTSYAPNKLEYSYETSGDRTVVFSEIFYDKAWTAYIDDVEAPHFRANYVLRGMHLPQGKHTIKFTYASKAFHTGSILSLIFSLTIILGLVWLIITYLKKNRNTSTDATH